MRLGLLVAALLAFTAPAGATTTVAPDVTATATLSQTLWSSQTDATLSVTFTNTSAQQDVSLTFTGAEWPGGAIGSPLELAPPTLSGPGTLHPAAIDFPRILPGTCVRGHPYALSLAELTIPAGATTTVQIGVSPFLPFWPDADYTPRVSAQDAQDSSVDVPVPTVSLSGPTGVHIELKTARAATHPGALNPISGTTDPAVADRTISLGAHVFTSAHASAGYAAIAKVRTDSRGHFHYAGWRPRRVGYYELLASIADPGPGLLPDHGCAASIAVS